MKIAMHGRLLGAAAALVVLANGVALVGVAYNRADPPDSVLQLTEREAQVSFGLLEGERTGVALLPRWRFEATPPSAATRDGADPQGPDARAHQWLDEAKLRSLGIELPPASAMSGRDIGARWPLPVEALLVMELDGPAYRQALESARAQAASSAAASAANPADKAAQRRAQSDQERLATEESEQSRLFVVDAGLDHARLRARYPNTTRHAIVRGLVGVVPMGPHARPRGTIEALSVDSVTVPLRHREVFDAVRPEGGAQSAARPFVAEVAFGRRLEPWIRAASVRPAAPAPAAASAAASAAR